MQSYEAVIVFHSAASDERVAEITKKYEERLKSLGAEMEKPQQGGRRKLPFKLQKHKGVKDGNFVVLCFKGEHTLPRALTEVVRITEEVVRFMVTKAEPKRPLEIQGKPSEEKTEISSSVLLDIEGTPGE